MAIISPPGDALLFATRGPDTTGDGRVDIRDGLALFLLHRDQSTPVQVTGHVLDFAPAMAVWAPDGTRFVVPVPMENGADASDHGHPHGLVLFDASGERIGSIPPTGSQGIMNPCFSPTGDRIAYVEGATIGLWEIASGEITTLLQPQGDGSFPRLHGWAPFMEGPVFTRSSPYAQLSRDADGDLVFPDELALEIAERGRGRVLTAPGTVPLRRIYAQVTRDRVFYVGTEPSGRRRLVSWCGSGEQLWTGPEQSLVGFEAAEDGTVWAWLRPWPIGAGAEITLARMDAPGQQQILSTGWDAGLLGLSGGAGSGMPLAAGSVDGERSLAVESCSGSRTRVDHGAWYVPSSRGGTHAAVLATTDVDGDGDVTAVDVGELRVTWCEP